METDEDSVTNLIEKSANNLTNNNSIQLDSCVVTDDTLNSANILIQKDNDETIDSEAQNNIGAEKPDSFESLAGNKNCDSESSDCNNKTNLNNNDLTISFVDEDEETSAERNQCNSDETLKGHNNCIGS